MCSWDVIFSSTLNAHEHICAIEACLRDLILRRTIVDMGNINQVAGGCAHGTSFTAAVDLEATQFDAVKLFASFSDGTYL